MQKYRKYQTIFLKSDIFDISENITIFSNLQHAPKRYILSTPCVSLYFLYQIKSGLFQATWVTWPIKTSRNSEYKKKTDRQTDRQTDIRTYNDTTHEKEKKHSPDVKYMHDKLIIMSVNTTLKSDPCVMYHGIKSW